MKILIVSLVLVALLASACCKHVKANEKPKEFEEDPVSEEDPKATETEGSAAEVIDEIEEEQKAGPELNPIDLKKERKRLKEMLLRSMKDKAVRRVDIEKDKQKAYNAFKAILIRTLLISKVALAGAPVGHLVGIFVALVDTSVNVKGNVWEQIKGKVDAKISQAISRYHFDKTQGHFARFQTVDKIKMNDYSVDDLVDVLTAKHDMMPNNFRDLGYSEELATLLPAWALFMEAGYLQLITDGKVKNRCALADELHVLRRDTIRAAKSLLKKRYRTLAGTGSEKRHPDYPCRGLPCYLTYHLTYTDRYNGKEKQDVLSKVHHIFRGVQQDVVDNLLQILIEPINAHFTQDMCLEGCDCPAIITKKEIDIEYPSSCFGTINEESRNQCALPCQPYSEGYNWCPYYRGRGAYSFEKDNNKIGSHWRECTEPDWKTCWEI